MPSIVSTVSLIDRSTEVQFWNINVRVGAGAVTRGMDVKLCQYLLYAASEPRGTMFSLTNVIGVWGPKSMSALAALEGTSASVLKDGVIDPIRPGQIEGSISHKKYKMILMQQSYALTELGQPSTDAARASGISPQDITDVLMKMPEDNTEMPADLRFALIGARDGNLEF